MYGTNRGLEEKVSVEHILPQNPETSSGWAEDFDINKIEQSVNMLGNLTLLEPNINRGIGNQSFETKKEEYLNRMNILDEEQFHSDYYKKFATCVIDNCYESSKINLNRLLSKMPDVKYKKTSKYTVDDFINIMKLYYHHFTTLRYIKSKYLRTIAKIDKVLYK